MDNASSYPPKRMGPRAIVRRWWIIPLAILATAAVGYGAASLQERTFTATSNVIVLSEPKGEGPGRAWDAGRLALTLATALPDDDRVLGRVAAAIDRPLDEVEDRLTAVNPSDTAVVRLRYRDEDRGVAVRGSRRAALSVVGPNPATRAVTPGSLELLQLARLPDDSGDSTAIITVFAAALGLGLGLILALALERADPRVDDETDCMALTGVPATALDDLRPPAAVAMLERWLGFFKRSSARIAILPVTRREAALAPEVARWLVETHRRAGEQVFTNGDGRRPAPDGPTASAAPRVPATPRPTIFRRSRPVPPEATPVISHGDKADRVELVPGGLPGSESAGEVEALHSDVVVLLIGRGTRSRDVARAVETFAQYGHRPDWILFVGSRRRLRKRIETSELAPGTAREAEAERASAGTPS
jgi:hypothetical protein